MVIQHNMIAMYANYELRKSSRIIRKSTEKMSSGYKINRARDDAARLAISEKMRGQIRGGNRASENIEDGISLVQIAEGALTETTKILHRITELAIQASNDTLTNKDREFIQEEVTQLLMEIDRIATNTTFNNEIHPLLNKKKLNEVNNENTSYKYNIFYNSRDFYVIFGV